MDRYKKMAADLKALKVEDDGEYFFLSTTLNGEADSELDPEALLPAPSMGLNHVQQVKRKSEITTEDRGLAIAPDLRPNKIQRVEVEHSEVVSQTVSQTDITMDNGETTHTVMSSTSTLESQEIITGPFDCGLVAETKEAVIPVKPVQVPAVEEPKKKIGQSSLMFEEKMGINSKDYNEKSCIITGGDGYFRFAALRLQYRWNSKLTNGEWKQAAILYNNPKTDIAERNYDPNHGLPQDNTYRDAAILKRHCQQFEIKVREWKAHYDAGEGGMFTWWKLRQISMLPPEKLASFVADAATVESTVTTTIKTAGPTTTDSKQASDSKKASFCGRCNLEKDGKGRGQNQHAKFNCSDGLPV
ncbi:hypothetical protein M422DRAFT_270374 [Sphaerobolus stellatus SS14]|uniref:Uncharacterized protein n=1 Tax=Sphaerobolus stellatus (strain SS14) TaxID=990650 RepID=A0A0C9TG50_SPHS4|nr:hypothetical protein M422DRAFT_270374 [Sphaerobolus stellatus SS14]